ncbi:hypothetical protein CLOP_g20412 [Closterium sp. NIES-67]|nr:hypothetical protein CLOP_g20412 [Closterium sp. NIES-67]
MGMIMIMIMTMGMRMGMDTCEGPWASSSASPPPLPRSRAEGEGQGAGSRESSGVQAPRGGGGGEGVEGRRGGRGGGGGLGGDRTIWPMDQKLLAIWLEAMGSALVVSLCSLICLTLLPLVCYKGKLPRALVDGLAAFGAGAMLGDAFLHQLPHAFGSGSHSHNHTQSHDHGHAHPHGHGHESHSHDHGHDHGHEEGGGGHAHSIEDLSVGIAVLVWHRAFLPSGEDCQAREELTSQGRAVPLSYSAGKRRTRDSIEGFTAGGFIYIAVAGVMPDMHAQGVDILSTGIQLASLTAGVAVAVVISLLE